MCHNQSKSLLLVEDEAMIAMAKKQQLEKIGYSVRHVLNGEAAVAMVGNDGFTPDLVLMDIDLGRGIDGTTAAEQILSRINVPVVFLSSHTNPEIVEKTEKITSYGYVVKNSGITVLDTSIKMAFKLFDAKQQVERSEAEYQRLYETMPTGIVYQLFDGTIVSANPAAERLLGLSLCQMKGLTSMDPRWEMIDKDGNHVTGSDHPVMEALRTGKTVGPVERGVLVPENNKYVWLSIVATPLFEKDAATPYQSYATLEDITARREAEQELQHQLAEKGILLKEIHHRIKNHMGQLESLLSLQTDSTENQEIKSALKDAISRIASTRVLYEKLLVGERYEDISMKSYLDDLIDSLVAISGQSGYLVVERDIADVSISSKRAISVGIILNELLTNVFKYAFSEERVSNADACHVLVALKQTGDQLSLVIEDNGAGLKDRTDETSGFGLTIVKMIAEQLNASFTLESDNGTRGVVTFDV